MKLMQPGESREGATPVTQARTKNEGPVFVSIYYVYNNKAVYFISQATLTDASTSVIESDSFIQK